MAAGIGLPVQNDGVIDDAPTEGSRMYAIIVCIFASLAGIFFGYDQGVTGGVLVMDSFLEDFCLDYDGNTWEECHRSSSKLPDNWRTFTTLYNVMYYLGCLFGAALGGWVVDRFGRRLTIFNAGVFFIVGTIWVIVTPKDQHTVVLFGRIVQGMGVGNSSFSVPIFGAEMAPKELRSLLSGFMQMTVVSGLLLANGINVANAVSLSTMANWGVGAIMIAVPKLFPYLNITASSSSSSALRLLWCLRVVLLPRDSRSAP